MRIDHRPGVSPTPRFRPRPTGSIFGEWGPVIPWPFIPVTAANLPDGRIVTFASNQRTNFPVGRRVHLRWRVGSQHWRAHRNQQREPRHVLLGTAMGIDGRPMFSGGRNAVRSSSIFDWETDQWVRARFHARRALVRLLDHHAERLDRHRYGSIGSWGRQGREILTELGVGAARRRPMGPGDDA